MNEIKDKGIKYVSLNVKLKKYINTLVDIFDKPFEYGYT